MAVYGLLVFVLLVLYFLLGYNNSNKAGKQESWFCNLAFAGIVFLAAFRGINVGADTNGYMFQYEEEIKYYSFDDLWNGKYQTYYFFYVLCKLFSNMGMPPWVWFAFIEIIYVSAIRRLIYSYSCDKMYSIILFVVSGLFGFSLAGLKQTLAMALILHAFLDLMEKKYLRMIILIVLTYFTHPVALIFGFGFVLYLLRNTRFYYPLLFVIVWILVFGAMSTMSYLVELLNQDTFNRYIREDGVYTHSTLYFYLLLLVSTIPFCKQYLNAQTYAKVFLGFLIITCSLQYLASYSDNLFRLAYLYTPFYTVYLPNAFDKNHTQASSIVKLIVLFGAIFFFLYAARKFHFTFMWQN